MVGFVLKKLVSQFLYPLQMVSTLFLAGWVLKRFTRFKKTGAALKFLSLVLFIIFGCGGLYPVLSRIEREVPVFDPTPEQIAQYRHYPVVVLGQGIPKEYSDLPPRYRERGLFALRLLEGVRVAKMLPQSTLIVSMGGTADESVRWQYLNDFMQTVNFPTNRVVMLGGARDTTDEARMAIAAIRELPAWRKPAPPPPAAIPAAGKTAAATNGVAVAAGKSVAAEKPAVSPPDPPQPVILVSSASHLPRGIRIFAKNGMAAIPAPGEYETITPERPKTNWYELPFPDDRYLRQSSSVIRECFGRLWEKIKR